MKTKIYLKYLMAPLSMLVILACSPDQYQMQGEYDDVYFTKNDRKGQPQIVAQNQQALAQQLNEKSAAQAAIPPALQEKYSNGEDPVYYYEEQGARVHSPRELNYDDFVYDYDNEHLAYYELPLDWDTDWSRNAFNNMMNQDFQFRMAWYEQYYDGDDWRMRQYLSGNSNLAARNNTMGLPQVGINAGFNSFGPGMYPGGMMAVDMNPMGFYDPFWRPINRFGFSTGLGFGWSNPYYCPPNAPIYTGSPIVTPTDNVVASNRQVVRGSRATIHSVQGDSQNGAQLRTRSQRITQVGSGSGSGSYAGVQGTSGGRIISGRGSTRPDGAGRTTRADLTVGNLKRVSTDAYRSNQGDRGSRTARYNRVDASQISSGRSASGSARAGRNTGFTRAAIEGASGGRVSRSGDYSNLSFDRRSSSSMSRSLIEKGNGSSGRSVFGRSVYSRSAGSPDFSKGSTGRSSSGSFNRGSSSGRSSGGVSRGSSSGGSKSSSSRSSSSGVSRSGRN